MSKKKFGCHNEKMDIYIVCVKAQNFIKIKFKQIEIITFESVHFTVPTCLKVFFMSSIASSTHKVLTHLSRDQWQLGQLDLSVITFCWMFQFYLFCAASGITHVVLYMHYNIFNETRIDAGTQQTSYLAQTGNSCWSWGMASGCLWGGRYDRGV